MRTTIELNDELLRQAKRMAADQGIPLRLVVETALRKHVTGARQAGSRYTLQWTVEKGRLQPGVDLEDRNSLFDLMDDRA